MTEAARIAMVRVNTIDAHRRARFKDFTLDKQTSPTRAAPPREDIEATVRELASPGIKGVELACEVVVRHPVDGDVLLDIIGSMVSEGELVEVEYATPENETDGVSRVKSFYLPAGTRVRILSKPRP